MLPRSYSPRYLVLSREEHLLVLGHLLVLRASIINGEHLLVWGTSLEHSLGVSLMEMAREAVGEASLTSFFGAPEFKKIKSESDSLTTKS